MTATQTLTEEAGSGAAVDARGLRRLGARRQVAGAGPALLVALLLVLLFVYPVVRLVLGAVTNAGAGAAFQQAFTAPGTSQMLWNTVRVIGSATVCATVIAVLFAWLNERTNARLGFIASVLPLTPLLVPPLASTIGWVFMASNRAGILNIAIIRVLAAVGVHTQVGPLNIYTFYGMVFLYTLSMVPFIYLPLAAAFADLDPSLEEASRISGRSPAYTLIRVTLPAIRHALASGLLLGIVMGIATFSIPLIVGAGHLDVLAVSIYQLLTFGYPPQTPEAVAQSLVIIVVVLTLSTIQRWVVSKGGHATIGGKGVRTGLVDLGPWRGVARAFMFLFIFAASVLPLLGLIYISLLGRWEATLRFSGFNFDAYRQTFFDNSATLQAFRNSLILAVAGTVVTLLASLLVSLYTVRRRNWLSSVLDQLAKGPAGISHLVLAIAILEALSGPPFRLGGSLTILIVAYIVFFMPQAYLATSTSLRQLAGELTEASAISGAGGFRTLRQIVVPLVMRGIAGAAVMLFVAMLGEVTGAVLLSGSNAPVLGFQMLLLWGNGTFSTIAALGVVMALVSLAATVLLLLIGRSGARS